MQDWKNLTLTELHAYFGLFFMLPEFWKTITNTSWRCDKMDLFQGLFFAATMSSCQFKEITQCIHFDNSCPRQQKRERNKFALFSTLCDLFISSAKRNTILQRFCVSMNNAFLSEGDAHSGNIYLQSHILIVSLTDYPRFHFRNATGMPMLHIQAKRGHFSVANQKAVSLLLSGVYIRYHHYVHDWKEFFHAH